MSRETRQQISLASLRKLTGWLLLLVGAWMLISPQSTLGLEQLKWAARYAFPGEVLLGVLVLCAAYYLIGFRAPSISH